MPHSPVITGMGCVSCLGGCVSEFERRLFAGECGLAPVERFDTEGLRNALAGEVKPVPPPPLWARQDAAASPDLAFLAAAVEEALQDSGLLADRPPLIGCVLSTNFAGCDAMSRFCDDLNDPTSFGAMLFDAGLNMVCRGVGVRGPSLTLSVSCASGTSAVGLAADWVRTGRADAVVVAGYDALSLFCLAGLSILRTVSTDTCRPFDRNRSGTIFAEGAAALVIEDAARVRASGRNIYGEILGHADTNNAYHLTAPDKDGEGVAIAVSAALRDAGVSPDEVDYVNAHGTATLYHDVTEVRALRAVLGRRAYEVPVSSIKGACGHLMGAAGTIEIIASLLAIRRQEVPPTVNLTEPDPECDLDHVPGAAKPWSLCTVLTNSAGIGGSNASLVLRG